MILRSQKKSLFTPSTSSPVAIETGIQVGKCNFQKRSFYMNTTPSQLSTSRICQTYRENGATKTLYFPEQTRKHELTSPSPDDKELDFRLSFLPSIDPFSTDHEHSAFTVLKPLNGYTPVLQIHPSGIRQQGAHLDETGRPLQQTDSPSPKHLKLFASTPPPWLDTYGSFFTKPCTKSKSKNNIHQSLFSDDSLQQCVVLDDSSCSHGPSKLNFNNEPKSCLRQNNSHSMSKRKRRHPTNNPHIESRPKRTRAKKKVIPQHRHIDELHAPDGTVETQERLPPNEGPYPVLLKLRIRDSSAGVVGPHSSYPMQGSLPLKKRTKLFSTWHATLRDVLFHLVKNQPNQIYFSLQEIVQAVDGKNYVHFRPNERKMPKGTRWKKSLEKVIRNNPGMLRPVSPVNQNASDQFELRDINYDPAIKIHTKETIAKHSRCGQVIDEKMVSAYQGNTAMDRNPLNAVV